MAFLGSCNKRHFPIGNPAYSSSELKFKLLIYLILPFSLLLSNSANAQNATSGGLTGIVIDPSGAAVPDTNVELRDNAKGITQTKRTNLDGGYLFSFVAPGPYTLTVTHPGFRTISQTLEVSPGPPSTLIVRLVISVGAASSKKKRYTAMLERRDGA